MRCALRDLVGSDQREDDDVLLRGVRIVTIATNLHATRQWRARCLGRCVIAETIAVRITVPDEVLICRSITVIIQSIATIHGAGEDRVVGIVAVGIVQYMADGLFTSKYWKCLVSELVVVQIPVPELLVIIIRRAIAVVVHTVWSGARVENTRVHLSIAVVTVAGLLHRSVPWRYAEDLSCRLIAPAILIRICVPNEVLIDQPVTIIVDTVTFLQRSTAWWYRGWLAGGKERFVECPTHALHEAIRLQRHVHWLCVQLKATLRCTYGHRSVAQFSLGFVSDVHRAIEERVAA